MDEPARQERIRELAAERMTLKRLNWVHSTVADFPLSEMRRWFWKISLIRLSFPRPPFLKTPLASCMTWLRHAPCGTPLVSGASWPMFHCIFPPW